MSMPPSHVPTPASEPSGRPVSPPLPSSVVTASGDPGVHVTYRTPSSGPESAVRLPPPAPGVNPTVAMVVYHIEAGLLATATVLVPVLVTLGVLPTRVGAVVGAIVAALAAAWHVTLIARKSASQG